MLYGVNPIYINTYSNVKYISTTNEGVKRIQKVNAISKGKSGNESKTKSYISKNDKRFDEILKSKLDKKV